MEREAAMNEELRAGEQQTLCPEPVQKCRASDVAIESAFVRAGLARKAGANSIEVSYFPENEQGLQEGGDD